MDVDGQGFPREVSGSEAQQKSARPAGAGSMGSGGEGRRERVQAEVKTMLKALCQELDYEFYFKLEME